MAGGLINSSISVRTLTPMLSRGLNCSLCRCYFISGACLSSKSLQEEEGEGEEETEGEKEKKRKGRRKRKRRKRRKEERVKEE